MNPDPRAVFAMGFAPLDLVDVSVGQLHVKLYPKIGPSMVFVYERAHAFQIAKAALENLPADLRLVMDAFGAQLNASSTVEGILSDWRRFFQERWLDFAHLTIQSFHNSKGDRIDTTTTAGDNQVLLPIVDGPIAACRKEDIRYVRVQCVLDFSALITIDPYPVSPILRESYYIELPQGTQVMTDDAGAGYTLVTFLGNADLRLLTPDDIKRDILSIVLQDGPVQLVPSDFNLPEVNTNSAGIGARIDGKILKLAWHQVCASVFNELCPGYSNQPQAALEHIRQCYIDSDGNNVCTSVFIYFQRMMNAMRPFAGTARFPKSVCNALIDGLDTRLLPIFRRNYPDHSVIHDLGATFQRSKFQEILGAMQMAEDEVNSISEIARSTVNGQAFHSDVSVNASQAERTLSRYGGGDGYTSEGGASRGYRSDGDRSTTSTESRGLGRRDRCFGCNGPHLWIKDGVVVCENADKPGVRAAAARNYQAWLDKSRARRNKRKNKDSAPSLYAGLSDADKTRVMNDALVMLAAAHTTRAVTTPSGAATSQPGAKIPRILIADIIVLSSATPTKGILPAPIVSNFPHIQLQLGSPDEGADCPVLRCVVDTAAALTTGNFHFVAAVAKRYPHCLAKIFVPNDYSPIVLSGIVQRGGESVTTELTVGFQFHLPYLTKEGEPTSILIATGPHVTVNLIVGLPFIQATRGIIDFADNVADLRALDAPPFPIEYRRATVHVPVMERGDEYPVHLAAAYSDVINEVAALERYFDAEIAYATEDSRDDVRMVRFGSSPPPTPQSAVPILKKRGFLSDPMEDYGGIDMGINVDMETKCLASNQDSNVTEPHSTPIRVAPKSKASGAKRAKNVFYDDRGFHDESEEYDQLLHNVDGGVILRKKKFPTPPLDVDDPKFNWVYDEALHGGKLKAELDVSHLGTDEAKALVSLIKEYWCVFDDRGTFVPVRNYECIIDTGTAAPIAIKRIRYGPREIPIMRKCISALAKVGQIEQIHEGQWLFKALLAPKPHQEHVCDIDNFVWRFCVNYIPLNQVTRQIAYPIPRCDSAVENSFGGQWIWLYDAPMGYHQITASKETREKLAFQGPDAIKWTYNVMPFGPTNGPATFVTMIHDVDSVWKEEAAKRGIKIGVGADTTIIIDDILNWARTFSTALTYMECQLRICKAYRLTLSLKKSHFFPKRLEFVGIDVSPDGNRPAMSKHELIKHWPVPELVRDVASFVGFLQFYSKFIPNFEIRVEPLRLIMEREYTERVGDLWTSDVQSTFDDLRESILCDPCLRRFDPRKLTILRTDFSAKGFGYVICQPDDDEVSLALSSQFMSGNGFHFLTKTNGGVLHPVAFGSRRTRGNEKYLHSYLGEGFAGDWAMNKVRHMCYGRRFVWVTDCYAVKFLLSYDGANQAILRLQMRLMGWDVDIVHRTNDYLVDADFWSRLDADLCYDPSFKKYLHLVAELQRVHPPPKELPIREEHMPYYRGPRIPADHCPPGTSTEDNALSRDHDVVATAMISSIVTRGEDGCSSLFVRPAEFGHFDVPINSSTVRSLYNSDVPALAYRASNFVWALYGFNSGHFPSTIIKRNLPFRIVLACDPWESNRALLHEFVRCPTILPSASALLDHIRASGDQGIIDGYLIHSHRYQTSEPATAFWSLQASIIVQLRLIRRLNLFAAFVHPDHDGRPVSKFVKTLTSSGWVISSTKISFPDQGDSVIGTMNILVGIHDSTQSKVEALSFRTPPSPRPLPLAAYIWEPFNSKEYSVSFAKDDDCFSSDGNNGIQATSLSKSMASCMPSGVEVLYLLHKRDADTTCVAGASVLALTSLCPPYDCSPNTNLFRSRFGVEFQAEGHTHVRPISPFEFSSCFGLMDSLRYRIAQPTYWHALDAGVPGVTSAWIFDHILERLLLIRDSNTEVFPPHQFAAPAAHIQAFTGGVIATRLPDRERWIQAIESDAELKTIRDIVTNPALLCNKALTDVNYNYHSALRKSLIVLEDGILIYREPLAGSESYTKLRLVPKELRNILFVAFHANPVGGHLNAYRTLHRLRLRYYWPGMWSYVKRMCAACPGCALSNPTRAKSSELVYNFPIEAPFMVLHVDAYMAGRHSGFEGSETYLVACCGMCTFGALEPVSGANATTFASAIMKIQMRYGFCHTIVLDKDSKFFGVCREALDLLKINCHVLSGDNHNPMLVERICRYFNKGLTIMTNERDSVRVALESLLLLLYAWNSCPVPGTEISRSMIAVGREFAFPLDYSSGKHWQLTSSPNTVETYSKELAIRLSACREVAELLVREHREWHRELINSRRQEPRVYSPGDIVFARRATRSDASRERVGKLEYKFTGPWRIVASLHGGSYSIEHCLKPSRTEKKHASDLSPYPAELIPFEPVDGADTRYGQLYKPIGANPFKEAGLAGFTPPIPFRVAQNFLDVGDATEFRWPTLSELNDEFGPDAPWRTDAERQRFFRDDPPFAPAVMYQGPPPTPPHIDDDALTPPSITTLVPKIISSADKLFFIAHKLGNSSSSEWRLVRVAFTSSISLYPSALQDGRFLVEFYVAHPQDMRCNAINQRYWLQYCVPNGITDGRIDAHLITPSDTSEERAANHNLQPVRRWVNLTHADTYIHGPFDFATVRGRKTRDRVDQGCWDALAAKKSMFANALPSFTVPTYSIHVDRGVHAIIPGMEAVAIDDARPPQL